MRLGNEMPLKALIFDLDGTLVDTAPDLLNATNHALSLAGRPAVTMMQLRSFVGHGAMALIENGIIATGPALDADALKPLHKSFLDYYRSNIAVDSRMYDGLGELLEKASKKGLRLGVCTNKLEAFSVKLLNQMNILRHFGAIVGGDTLKVMKPNPAPYLETAARLRTKPSDTLMFGDSETDIRTAQAAGVPVIAVSFGYTAKPVQTFNPTHVIDHFDEAWGVIEKYL